MPELISTMADCPKGQFPRANQEGQHKANQEVIEEFERIADDGGHKDLDLVASQTRPAIEYLEHGVFPPAPVHFDYSERASRLRTAYPQRVSRGRRERQAQARRGARLRRSDGEGHAAPQKPEHENNCASCLNRFATFLQAASCSGFPSERCSAHARLI
jgi:hypothetical protein